MLIGIGRDFGMSFALPWLAIEPDRAGLPVGGGGGIYSCGDGGLLTSS